MRCRHWGHLQQCTCRETRSRNTCHRNMGRKERETGYTTLDLHAFTHLQGKHSRTFKGLPCAPSLSASFMRTPGTLVQLHGKHVWRSIVGISNGWQRSWSLVATDTPRRVDFSHKALHNCCQSLRCTLRCTRPCCPVEAACAPSQLPTHHKHRCDSL